MLSMSCYLEVYTTCIIMQLSNNKICPMLHLGLFLGHEGHEKKY